ncbi:hypothetical protein PVK06_002730 [Gossypium arboreum]|uniref:RNase H type-1 domain-containing protein n=1 Tax=Gossypium arboreum TaxID=29729 RepID=A0ABR0R5Q0_GOSAR|nr:hypothetical protein PVK06_002730 [Gossypium arboreum]
MVLDDGAWNLDLFRVWLLEDVIQRIITIPSPHPNNGVDQVIWASLLQRIMRGLGQCSSCGIYSHDTEDMFHVLQDCVAAKNVWKHVVPTFEIIQVSLSWACQFEASQNASKPLSPNPYHKRHIEEMLVHLFYNGVVERGSGKAVAGGVIQDMDDNWILKISHYLGNCTPFKVELWGILDGILVMLKNGFK